MAVSSPTTPETGSRTRPPGPISEQLIGIIDVFGRSQYQLVMVAARFADSVEWVLAGDASAGAWLARHADIETCTAREWIRIGRLLPGLPAIHAAFESGTISYSKVRALTRIADADNESELLDIALDVAAGDLGRALAAWLKRNLTPEDLADHQHKQRSVKWRTDPDGMITFTLRLPPHPAALLIAFLTTVVLRARPVREPNNSWPTLAQQHADAFSTLLEDGTGRVDTEIVLHVRGDGATCDDGTPIADTVIKDIAPDALIRVLIHDAVGNPINASGRQRHPTTRQKRVVKERDHTCVDCGRGQLLQYDHNPDYQTTNHTVIDELELRCGPCHRTRHRNDSK